MKKNIVDVCVVLCSCYFVFSLLFGVFIDFWRFRRFFWFLVAYLCIFFLISHSSYLLTYYLRFFNGKKRLGGMKVSGWRDAWLELHNEPTLESPYGFTFSQDNPRNRIDFMFIVGDELSVKSMETFGEDQEMWPSDHLGLNAHFYWN